MNPNSSLKVAVISPGFLPVPAVAGGAIELFIEKTLPDLKKLHAVTVFSIDHPKLKKQKPFHYISNGEWARIFFSLSHFKDGRWNYIYRVGQILEREDFDVIHYHGHPLPLYFLLTHFKLKTPLIFHVHNSFLVEIENKVAQTILKKVSQTIVVSEFIKKQILKKFPDQDHIHVIHNGVDFALFQSSKFNSPLRARYHIPKEHLIFCYAGRWVQVKGLAQVIQAFQKIRQHNPQTALCLLGSADPGKENQQFAKQLKQLSDQNPQGIFWHGFVSPRQLADYYQDCDVFVSPSLWQDPFPMAFLEAMAAGLPMITTRNGGIPEMVHNGENGILLESDSELFSEHLIQAMQQLIDRPDLRRKFSENNKKHIQNFSWGKVAQKISEVYWKTRTSLKP